MSSRSSTAASRPTFAQNVRDTFAALKDAGEPEQLETIPIPDGGVLLPVAELHAHDELLIEALTRWREASAYAFASEAAVTTGGTAAWLRMGLLDAEDRMLWLVTGSDGHAVGHMGFANALNDRGEIEVDNVVRGSPRAHPGIMSAGLRALTAWARHRLRPATISLRVLADNDRALRFYHRLGWEEERRIPLRRSIERGAVYFDVAEDGEAADREFIRMVLAAHRTVCSA